MPFVQWVVEPKFVSRKELHKTTENEFEAVSNNTLVAVLQQLACIVKYANRIFDQVGNDLNNIHNRSTNLTGRIRKLNETVSNLDAKKVPIPVGDLTKFSLVKEHYAASQPAENKLFLRENRPLSVQLWYDAASISPVHIMRQIDKFREDGCRTSKYFVCVPVFKDNQTKMDLEIETRRPASMCGVRKWQNEDEDGGMTDISSLDRQSGDEIDTSLLRLPSPEERTHAFSLKFPYSDVPIDVTGNSFRRMGSLRRSFLQQVEFFTRKKKKKKSKSNRRNTIAGGDEIEAALNDFDKKGESSSSSMSKLRKRFSIAEGARFFKENGFEHLYSSLRRPAENKSVQTGEDEFGDIKIVKSRLYETLNPTKHSAKEEKKSKNKSNIPISTYSQAMTLAVKLRGNSTRTGAKGEDSGQSSSGNWSASSSTRTSVESENLKAAAGALGLSRTPSQASLSKDSALSDGTAQNESNDYQSDNSISTNASLKNGPQSGAKNFSVKDTEHWLRGLREEVASEDGTSTTGTLTPLLGNRTFSPLNFIDDEDSSVYSVDTDGYYTSMHTDSGLRSLSSSSKPADGADKEASDETENGSTMSSISTIDQTDSGEANSPERKKKIPPLPPKRLSSLRSSPTTSEATRPSQSPSPESDNSWKKKTVINASRIPSMCIVTPTPSDDENSSSNGGSLDRTLDDARKSSSSGESSEKLDRRSSLTASIEKKVSWSEGSNTLPRSFGKSHSGGPFSTHSWPRTPPSHLVGTTSHSTTELRKKKDAAPRLPLKYVQHITVTPGKRSPMDNVTANVSFAPIQSSGSAETSGNRAQEAPKIIYATNSLERKKNFPVYDRPKAHVALDAQGRIVRTPTSENPNYQKPNYPTKSSAELANPAGKRAEIPRYNCNTLPRARVAENGPPVPLFQSSKTQEAFRPNTFQYASLPRKMPPPERATTPQRGSTPEEDSSPRDSMADLPPPMSLISPTLSQTARRWTYQTMPNLRISGETRGLQKPSYLPIPRTNVTNVSNGNRPPKPLYRPPPPPNARNYYNAPPPIYQLEPRSQPPQMSQRPAVNGSGPPTPQRHYVLNVPRGVQVASLAQSREGINTRSGGMTNGQFYGPKSPITPESARNGFCRTLPANYTNGDRYAEEKTPRAHQQPVDSLRRSPKPSMTTDDLFTAIHQSKKRLNLKTDLDRSVSPSSVRSESPSLFGGRSQIPRVSSPESGTLSPRCNSPGGRKSWSGDCPSPGGNSPGDRRSWAMDRLGVNKPTTMRDFKMLLLHASRNTSPQNVQQRKSASEMLKVTTPTKSPQPVYTRPATPQQATPQQSRPQQSRPQQSTPLNGHLGIPIIDATTPPQRVSPRPINHNLFGRNRSRYPFHPHTDILSSPIWEDNMEDVDSQGSDEDFYFPSNSANGYGINTARRALY